MRRVIVSLCDHSGNWARTFAQHDRITVYCIDPKHRTWWDQGYGVGSHVINVPMTVEQFLTSELMERLQHGREVVGVIAQPVCTQFSGAGARWWAEKDENQPELLEEALQLVDDCLQVVKWLNPGWWVMENPVGRLGRLKMGPPVMTYQPHEYSGWVAGEAAQEERYTKRTCLWGDFHADALKMLKRDLGDLHGSKMWAKYGGKSDRTKELRSVTPTGFARAWFAAHAETHALETAWKAWKQDLTENYIKEVTQNVT